MTSVQKQFGKDISQLHSGRNKTKMKCSMLQMMTQMTIDLNMFFVLVKYVIVSNLNNTLVITIKNGNRIGWD